MYATEREAECILQKIDVYLLLSWCASVSLSLLLFISICVLVVFMLGICGILSKSQVHRRCSG